MILILIKDSTIFFLFFILVRLQFYIYAQICPAGLLIHIFDSLIKKKKKKFLPERFRAQGNVLLCSSLFLTT